MFIQRGRQQNQLYHQLKMIANLAHYQPIPSIPNPSEGFNYTLSHQRYSQYQTPRVIRKQRIISKRSEDLKLSTILQTQNFNNVFPRIAPHLRKQSHNLRKVTHLPTSLHKERQSTEATGQRSLRYQSPLTTQEEKFVSLQQKSGEDSHITYENIVSNKSKHILSPVISSAPRRAKDNFHMKENSEESSEDDEYEKNAIPGPGSYNYSYSDFDKKSVRHKSTKASFNSQQTRFPVLKKVEQSIPIVINQLEIEREKKRQQKIKSKQNKKIFVPFNVKSPRLFEADQLAKSLGPGPQDYSPRFGIQEELIKKIQRNFRGNFGYNQQRFRPQKNIEILGPGYYDSTESNEIEGNENYYFKSQKQRF